MRTDHLVNSMFYDKLVDKWKFIVCLLSSGVKCGREAEKTSIHA